MHERISFFSSFVDGGRGGGHLAFDLHIPLERKKFILGFTDLRRGSTYQLRDLH